MASKNARFTAASKSDANSVKPGVASSTRPATPAVAAEKPAVAAVTPAAAVAAATPVAAAVAGAAIAATAATAAAPAALVAEAAKSEAVRERSAVAGLVARLHDADAEVARDAAANLGRLPANREAVAALSAVLWNAEGYYHAVVRAAAAAALGSLGDRSAVEALIHATRDTMAEASEEAIKALGLLGDARALPALREVVNNEKGFFLEHVRRTAGEAARRIDAARNQA